VVPLHVDQLMHPSLPQGHLDTPLNARGRGQAAAAAKYFAPEGGVVGVGGRHGVTAVYSSDLARAAQTADVIAAAIDLTPVTRDIRMREMNLGIFQGLTKTEAATKHGGEWARCVGASETLHLEAT
jgi:broad specificity phosphatase PhoE